MHKRTIGSRHVVRALCAVAVITFLCAARVLKPSFAHKDDVAANGVTNTPRIYVYDIPDRLLLMGLPTNWLDRQSLCRSDMGYTLEIDVHTALKESRARTLDPKQADFFFVPQYAVCLMHTVQQRLESALDGPPIDTAYEYTAEIINYVIRTHDYFNMSGGANHLFVVGHEVVHRFYYPTNAPRHQLGIASLCSQCIIAGPHGQLDPYGHWGGIYNQFSFWKDIVIPPLEHREIFLKSAKPSSRVAVRNRTCLLHFRGTIHKDVRYSHGVRQLVKERFAGRGNICIHEGRAESDAHLLQEMRNAKFCFAPPGWVTWSGRLATIIAAGCIPVIVADGTVLPFEDLIDYHSFAVKLSETDIPDLERILTSMPDDVIERRENALLPVRAKLMYLSEWQRGEAIDAFLEVLRMRIRRFPVAFESFS